MLSTYRWIFSMLLLLLAYSVRGQVTAGFTATHLAGCPPLVDTFTNTTTPAAGTTYVWDMDNGTGPITLTNPATSYLSSGTYTVTLTATNGSFTSRATKVITVYPLPTVGFTVGDTAICPGVPITFTSTSVGNVPGPVTYTWSSGDGYSSTVSPYTHAIALPGYYNITLTATNADGCVASLTKPAYVHVFSPPAPSVTANTTLICHPSGTVNFTSSITGTPSYTYTWSFGDGSPSSTLADPSHLYGAPGSYTVKLTVTDGNGCEDSISLPNYITVTHLAAAFTAPDTACVNTPVAFSNTSTAYTSDKWYYGTGDTSLNTNGNYTYSTRDSYFVKLVVTDGTCSDTITHRIIIPAPVVSFTISPVHPCPAPEVSTFTAGVPGGSTVSWNFGDGGTGSGLITTHTYTKDTTVNIQMISTSDLGCKDTVNQFYTIYDIVFSSFSTPELNYRFGRCLPAHDTFDASVLTDVPYVPYRIGYPYGPISYSWTFGDGSPADTSPVAIHIYTAVGAYHDVLNIVTANGCHATYLDSARVGIAPVVTFTATPLRECYRNNKITFTRTILSGTVNYNYWKFGEGVFDDGESDTSSIRVDTVTHHFVIPGIFSDTLISYDNGCPDTFIRHDYVIIDSPMARVLDTVLCYPVKTVQFRDSSLGDNTWKWYFGDGDSSVLRNPLHVYPDEVTYHATFVCYNIASGCRDTEQIVANTERIAGVISTPDTAICRDDNVTLTFDPTLNSSFISYYSWELSPGTSGDYSNRYFSDTFHTTGIYTIRFVAKDENGCIDTVTRANYIHVSKPVAHFTVAPPSVCWGMGNTFTDASTDIPGAFITHYHWAYGDSAVGNTGPVINHIYTATGTFTSTEIVTDNVGCMDTLSRVSSVTIFHPVAGFSVSATHVCAYAGVHFNNTSTTGSSYWSFGDGTHSTVTSPIHDYSDTGHYTVSLVLTDAHGCRDTVTRIQYITVTKPHAAFSLDDSVAVCPPLVVHFTNASSGGISYRWEFGNGGPSNALNPNNTYTAPGYDTVSLVVADTAGCTDTAYAHVKIFGYAGAFNYNTDSGCVPLFVAFNVDLSNISATSTITWDFSDGIVRTTGRSDTISHTYVLPGSFVPKLIISDAGCIDTSRGATAIKVDAIKPGFTALPDPVCANDTLFLADTSTSFWSGITGHSWNYNGTTSTLDSPLAVFTSPGTDSIILHTTDGWGCTAIARQIVTVNPAPYAGRITTNLVNTFCIGYKFIVQDTVAGGVWSFSNSHVSISGDTITAISAGTDTLFYTVTNGCGPAVAIDTFHVPPPLPPIMGNTGICIGDTTILSDSVFGGMWHGGNVHVQVGDNSVDSGVVVGISAGTATVTYQMDLGCYITTVVTVNTIPAVATNVGEIVCFGGNDGSITILPGAADSADHYHWSNGDSTSSISGLAPGTYSVRISDTVSQCAITDSFTITAPDSLQITADITNVLCLEPNGAISIKVTGGTPPYKYEWSDKSTGSSISNVAAGTYSVTVTDANGCTQKYSTKLEDSACHDIIIFNAISPNGDGTNDTWVIEGLQHYPGNTVQVFDKWGNEVFEETNYKNDWGGMGKGGKELPDGTYYYLVKTNGQQTPDGHDAFTGYLMIKR